MQFKNAEIKNYLIIFECVNFELERKAFSSRGFANGIASLTAQRL